MCTETLEFFKNLQLLKKPFINRGFNKKLLDTDFQRLSENERNALLPPKSKEKDK